jgi:SPP1 family predicted phage head-tail adaptor
VRAGALDRRITIETNSPTVSASGHRAAGWSTFATIWASKRDVRGDERFRAAQIEDRVETVWRIRFRTDLDPTMRILYRGDYYEIKGIVELGRRDALELLTARQISAT